MRPPDDDTDEGVLMRGASARLRGMLRRDQVRPEFRELCEAFADVFAEAADEERRVPGTGWEIVRDAARDALGEPEGEG